MGFVLFPGKEGVFCEMVSSRDYPVLVSYHLEHHHFQTLNWLNQDSTSMCSFGFDGIIIIFVEQARVARERQYMGALRTHTKM
jgi:hypothetical protein